MVILKSPLSLLLADPLYGGSDHDPDLPLLARPELHLRAAVRPPVVAHQGHVSGLPGGRNAEPACVEMIRRKYFEFLVGETRCMQRCEK